MAGDKMEKTCCNFVTNCTNQQSPHHGGAVLNPVWVGLKWLLAFPRVPVTPGTPLHFFAVCRPLNDRRKAAHSFFKIGRLFSLFLFSCPSLVLLCLLILLLLLMSGNVHPNPGPIFPCSMCTGNVTWWGKSMQCCACSKMGPSKVLTTFLIPIQSLSQFLLAALTLGAAPCRITVTPSSDSFDMYTSTVQSSPASANAAISPHSRLQTSYAPLPIIYLLPLPFHHYPLLLAFLLRLLPPLPPDSLRVLQWNAGGLQVRSTELLHFLSSHPVDLICIQKSNLNSSSSFWIPGFSALRSDRTHPRSGILSSDTTHASGGIVIFVRQGLSFSELFTSSLSLLDLYSDYVGVNISPNNSSSVSFLDVYALPLFAAPQPMAEPTPFLFPFFPPSEISSSFWGTSIAITPFGTQELLPTFAGKKYSTESSPLTSFPSITLTHPPFSTAPLAVAPLLTSPLPPFLLPFLAPGRCFRTLVLTTYQFFYLFLSLQYIAPTSVPLPSIFRKLAEMGLPPTLTLTVLLQRNTHLFLFPLQLLSLPLWH